jgi:hypothetical protein
MRRSKPKTHKMQQMMVGLFRTVVSRSVGVRILSQAEEHIRDISFHNVIEVFDQSIRRFHGSTPFTDSETM